MSAKKPVSDPRTTHVITAAAMREADRFTIEDFGIPSFALMESAARAAAARIEATFGPLSEKTVACFCGKGNNGGDGLVVARVLHAHGTHVRVIAMAEPEDMSDDAARNWYLLTQLAEHDDRITLVRFESLHQVAAYPPADLHVDALLGTGLTSDLRAPILGLVGWMNGQHVPTVALDMPTGLHTDLGTVLGAAVAADLTITMAVRKAGLLLNDGPRHTGQVEVVEIGIPGFVLDHVQKMPGCALLPDDATIRAWLPERARDAYKYSVGLALIVGGAPGMTGAPVMSSMAAARAGAGYVQCACQEAILPTLATKLTEVTTLALPASPAGGIDPAGAMNAMQEQLAKAQALLVGPGLGRHPDTQQFIRDLLVKASLPVVIDADGLNALADDPGIITRHAEGRWILTPHAGEFKRLAGKDVDLTDRLGTVQRYAQAWNCVLILKGMPSVVGCPDGTVYINRTGNPALATAGTGDVLAGLTAGLLAQGLLPERAAVCALHLGGAAADRYATHRAARTMLASDLLEHLPLVLHERFAQ